ncbi:competence type IV pilus minor pilin ComGG [Desertibacillus haloalkaliphilus]|uniref:competence type IV pilus minor pilin ComGG n=1 Tax=Desertibacillus haloalkaliphilus TaxID=1328930 RepID=UPI001C27F94B|nr:competence type IV pilus minor pilin ComGG [Desertibacillus haloalkaliphilus]MBU8908983.1 hypothetical protein [Desertibacillus haloalkaliphilus]
MTGRRRDKPTICKQKGFIMPLTMVLTFIVSGVLLHQLQQYLNEKQFFYEQEQIYIIEQLAQMGAHDLDDVLREDTVDTNGQFHYEIGTASYWIQEQLDDTLYVRLTLETIEGRKRLVRLYYDLETLTMKAWWEVN